MKGKRLLVGISVVSLALFGCGGDSNPAAGLSDCNISGYDIYLGYYYENPSTNPEDPTTGFIVACIPSSNGSFASQFLFSYSGCAGGVDVGDVSGNRIGNSISGNWSGTVDGTSIGGDFSGNWDGTKFSGTWTNSSGKVHIKIGSCEYYVAPDGSWVLYGLDTDDGGLNINVSGSEPTINWNNSISGAAGFFISVYDKQCMYDKISLEECTMWSLVCPQSVSSLTYGTLALGCGDLKPAQALTSNKDYVVAITAFGGTAYNNVADIKAYASKVFIAP